MQKIRIVCICYPGEINEDLDSSKIYQLYYNDKMNILDYDPKRVIDKDIILFIDFFEMNGVSSLTEDKNELLKKTLIHESIYIVFHNRNMPHQKELIKDILEDKWNEKRFIDSKHNAGVYGAGFLKDIPDIDTREKWDELFDKILSQFYDEELEKYIENVINDKEGAMALLDVYISNLQNKV